MRESEIDNKSCWPAIAKITFLTVIAFAVHALVLRFVYPGYYKPLWPNHDDFYMPLQLANSPGNLLAYLGYPRPVGMMFLGAIGHLGLHGSIFAFLFLIALNCAMVAEAFRRITKIRMGVPFIASFAIYLYLLFSQPYFYTFAIHDGFSQLSFCLLLLSVIPLINYYGNRSHLSLCAFFIVATLAFLTKETYGLSAIFLASIWFVAKRKEGTIQAAIPAMLTGIALVAALAINSLNKSPFTGGSKSADAPYHIVLSPSSVMGEWWRYLTDGLNPLTGAIVILGVCMSIIALRRKSPLAATMVALLPVAGVLSWLPTSLLPNHHYPGYSWNGAYIIFLPILSMNLLARKGWLLRTSIFSAMAIAAAYSPAYSAGAYKKNDWTLLQEKTEINLLKALAKLTRNMPTHKTPSHVLVSGIDFPFSPFKLPFSLRIFPNVNNVLFDVVHYGESEPTVDPRAGVTFIHANDVALSKYQAVWAFRSDGTLITSLNDASDFAELKRDDLGFGSDNLLIYPKLLDVFGNSPGKGRHKPNGYDYLKCGSVLASYNDLAGAEACLGMSIKDIPSNPYPYFYLGKIQEDQGKTCLARESYGKAVELDDPKSPNPFFDGALRRLSHSGTNGATTSCGQTPSDF